MNRDSVLSTIRLFLEDAIQTHSKGVYWPGCEDYLYVHVLGGRVVVVSLPGYTGETKESVVNGRAFLPAGAGLPESFNVALCGLVGKWMLCKNCGIYAAESERSMHYSSFGHVQLGCWDCYPPEKWVNETWSDATGTLRFGLRRRDVSRGLDTT